MPTAPSFDELPDFQPLRGPGFRMKLGALQRHIANVLYKIHLYLENKGVRNQVRAMDESPGYHPSEWNT